MGLFVLSRVAWETVKISLPTVIEARRGTLRQEACDERLRSWAQHLLRQVRAEVTVGGLENVEDVAGPYVVVSNHQSHYDIPALYVTLPFSLRMAAKAELFKTPLWGRALRDSGFVKIERSSPRLAHLALEQAGQTMRDFSVSLFVAPEGTRSVDGTLGRFKTGAFRLAQQTGLPILPVAINGTRDIHRKGQLRVKRGARVRVEILPPVVVDRSTNLKQTVEQVRSAIAAHLPGDGIRELADPMSQQGQIQART